MSNPSQFDFVIFGASGFTGRLVAEYLIQHYGDECPFRWAMAGRNKEKLAQVREQLGGDSSIAIIEVNSNDRKSLRDMVSQTRLVLTTVGPYQLYGSELVAACAESGTDYVDLCGEPVWMRQMIEQHQATAEENGARIVFSCGFDSIPFDLGVWYLQQHAMGVTGKALPTIKGRVRKMRGSFSGGTAASLNATLAAAKEDRTVFSHLLNPYALVPGFKGVEQPPGHKPYFDQAHNTWLAPFIMAPINTKNVHRSNALLGFPYGQDFRYDEMLITGPGEKGEAVAHAVANDKSLSSKDAPKPGEGPSKEEREAGCYDALFMGQSDTGKLLQASVSAQLDPGYGSTSRMIAESAICLLADCTDTKGGIWTPAAAMGGKLIERLQQHAGLTFRIES